MIATTLTLPNSLISKENIERLPSENADWTLPAELSMNRNVRQVNVTAASRHRLARLFTDPPKRNGSRQVG